MLHVGEPHPIEPCVQAAPQTGNTVAGRGISPGLAQALDRRSFDRCLRACRDCELACLHLVEAALDERSLDRVRAVVRLCVGCADACASIARLCPHPATGSLAGLDRAALNETLVACLLICATAEAECRLAGSTNRGAARCARACGECADECRSLLRSLRDSQVETRGVEVRPVAWAKA
jgi:hypothetical protein